METNIELRPIWRRLFSFDWQLGLFLLIVICVPRFYIVLLANETASYNNIAIMMVISTLLPFVFLNKKGLKEIGLTKPRKFLWIPLSLILGFAFALSLGLIGNAIYGQSMQNWYAYIGLSYNLPESIGSHDKLILFLAMAVSGMIFSPFGEEFLFRGIVHSSFAQSVGQTKASLIDSLAFAVVHLSHFGFVFLCGTWDFFALPALIWCSAMFLLGLMFYQCRRRSGSLFGAVIAHSGFNLGMIFCIFYLL